MGIFVLFLDNYMEWLNNESIKTILQVSGVSGILAFSIFGLIKVFAGQFAKKDDKFNESITSTTNQFMQFIERERIQHNSVIHESVKALTLIQQELNKNSSLYQKQIEVMDKLSENITKLEHRSEMHYAEIKSQQAEIMMALGKMLQRMANN